MLGSPFWPETALVGLALPAAMALVGSPFWPETALVGLAIPAAMAGGR